MDANNEEDKDTVTDIMAQLSGQPSMAVGEYIGPDGFFRNLDEAATKARYENVAAHVQNVLNVIGKPPSLSAAEIMRIRSWSRKAGEVPPTEEALSAIIEAALRDILLSAEAPAYEDAANELSNRSAQLLLTARPDKRIEPEQENGRTITKLAELGLISRPTLTNLFSQFCASIIGMVFGAIILLELIVPYGAALLPRYIPEHVGRDLIIDAAAIIALFGLSAVLFRAQKYWLTQFGKSVQDAAKPFFNRDKPFSKRGPFASVFARNLSIAFGLSIFAACILPLSLRWLPKELRYLQESPVVFLTAPPPPAAPTSPTPPKPAEQSTSQVTLPAEDVSKLKDVWKSISAQLENTIELPQTLDEIVKRWHQSVDAIISQKLEPVERQRQLQNAAANLNSDLSNYRTRLLNRRISLGNLANTYSSYPNISTTLNASTVDQKFNRYAAAIDSLRNELSINPDPRDLNSANALKPFQEAVQDSLKDLTTWASQTRDFADKQIKELSNAVQP